MSKTTNLSGTDIQLLRELEYVFRVPLTQSIDGKGFVRPMDLGGRDASHHSATLARLIKLGFVERRPRGGKVGERGCSYLYRITAAGVDVAANSRSK